LLFYRDRELEVRRALENQSWAEMRRLPSIANQTFFESRYKRHFSPVQSMMQNRRMMVAFEGQGVGLFGGAAEAEARRRLIVAAIALERFHLQRNSYPRSLSELVPDFLKAPPVDFMDGQPLRYSRTGDGHFFLYSVGLDCVDDGGKIPPPRDRNATFMALRQGNSPPPQGDIVWPCPATSEAAAAHEEKREKQANLEQAARAKQQAEEEARAEAARRERVKQLLGEPKFKHAWVTDGEDPASLKYKDKP